MRRQLWGMMVAAGALLFFAADGRAQRRDTEEEKPKPPPPPPWWGIDRDRIFSPITPKPLPITQNAAAPKWDVQKTLDTARQGADEMRNKGFDFGNGKCAEYASRAIRKTIPDLGFANSAKDYGAPLQKVGFREVPVTAKDLEKNNFKPGDVVVIEGVKADPAKGVKKDHPHGHMAIFDGKNWIADFVHTKDIYGGEIRHAEPKFKVYRHESQMPATPTTSAAPKPLGGVLVNPTARKDDTPLPPGTAEKILEQRPDGPAVKFPIKLPKPASPNDNK